MLGILDNGLNQMRILFLIVFLLAIPVRAATFDEIMYMTATIYGEARGEPYMGKLAIAWVILNRGGDIISTVTRDRQFSAWNYGDSNRFMVERIAIEGELGNNVVKECLRAALDALQNSVDPTGGANHYHTVDVKPYWIKGETPLLVIGNHVFYKL